ncbi:Gfo/Idh/MocA family protein [Amycolatopsis sp. NPDC059657]|uniref:Gfo/Idh/MocA family protein n=1 Tax=Amycolatopsis sp. NPDC059657 TaxID=3346899 RepID=UPI00366D7D32
MFEPLRVGVLGCAEIARRRMLPAFAAADGVELTGVAARDYARAVETAAPYDCKAFESYEALIESVDAVYIPLPAALHERWVERALDAGKHVLSEKPVTTNASGTRRLLALARDRGRVLMENVLFVHHGQHIAARRLVRDGAIGTLTGFEAAFTVPRPKPGDIRHSAELGGGALLDVGIYPVRAAVHLLGGPLRVKEAAYTSVSTVEYGGTATLETADGVTARLTYGMDHEYRSAYTFTGSKGTLALEHVFTTPADRRPMLRLDRSGGSERISLEPEDQVAATVRAFASACRIGRTTTADCLAQADLLDEIKARSEQEARK